MGERTRARQDHWARTRATCWRSLFLLLRDLALSLSLSLSLSLFRSLSRSCSLSHALTENNKVRQERREYSKVPIRRNCLNIGWRQMWSITNVGFQLAISHKCSALDRAVTLTNVSLKYSRRVAEYSRRVAESSHRVAKC